MERESHKLFKNCHWETPFEKAVIAKPIKETKEFKKNFVSTETPEVTKAGKRSDSSKQTDTKVNQIILRDYFLSDTVIRASIQTDTDNICTDFCFELEEDSPEAEYQKERAENLFYKNNFMEQWRNIQMQLGVYDDSYQEVQTFLNEGELQFESYVLETTEIQIKNKKEGGIDYYAQYLQGKEVARLEPSEVIHYRFNAFGSRDYGMSLVATVLHSSAVRKFVEKYNASIFQNHKPRGVWMFPGDMSKDLYDDNVDLIIDGKTDPNKDLFLRGTSIDYKNFMDQKDVDFLKGYVEARNEILIGLGVPPIMLSLPEGSNKANSDAQLQAYDRRVLAKQNAFAYKINTELLPKLGLDKIKFVVSKSSKRDEERELNIVNKMKGLITLNEARKEIGYPELDTEIFPEAEQIWKEASNPFGMINSSEPSPGTKASDKVIEKSMSKKKTKKSVRTSVVSLASENKAKKPIEQFYNRIISEAKKRVDAIADQGKFKKAFKGFDKLREQYYKKAAASDDLLNTLKGMFSGAGIDIAFATFVQNQYLSSGNKISKTINQDFQPNQEELDFLRSYNLDAVRVSSERELAKIKQILEVGLIQNQSTKTIKQALDKVRDTAINNTNTLVRTELNRANNMGSLTAMKSAGVKTKKYLLMVDDNRTSNISKALNRKYGSENQAIILDEEFRVVVDGRNISGLAPPFHPNDRDILIYVME